MEVPPIPLVICPRAAHLPCDEAFPSIPSHNLPSLPPITPSPTTKEGLALSSFQLPFKRLVATITFTSWSCQYFVAGTIGVTLFTKEVTSRILLDGCEHLAPLSLPVFANKPRNIHASGCVTQSCALSQSAKGKILCQESLSSCSFSSPASLGEGRDRRSYCLELRVHQTPPRKQKIQNL